MVRNLRGTCKSIQKINYELINVNSPMVVFFDVEIKYAVGYKKRIKY